MKWIIPIFACCLALQASGKRTEPPPPPAFDADLFQKDKQVFSGHVEFLYWTIEEPDLDYALKMNTAAWGAGNANYAQGHFQTASYNFDPGMRLALSFYRAERFWEVKWQYLRGTFRGSDHTNAPEGSGEFLTGTWPQVIGGNLVAAKSHLHFNYNIFDMLVARVFNPNPHLRIRMIGGPTTAWMSQQWIVRYLNNANENTRINNRWSYAAGGLKFGTTIDWYWGEDIYVTAAGSAGLLMGSYHNQAKQTANAQPAGGAGYNPAIPLRNAKLENIRPSFTAQMSFGPSWQKNYKNARTEFFAGYEITIWTNLQELYHSTAGNPNQTKETWINAGTLALHGVSIRLSGDF
ncbi:MAG TPA: hypothetical protein DCE71_03895 [Parachlamydiales bacterium]|nr:hypothetical protein [Parachlamydiales bacterium]